MNAAKRTYLIKRALLRTLAECGDYPVIEEAVREQAEIKLDFLQPTTGELDAGLKDIDANRLASALPTERGRKLQLTDAGRHWLAQNP